MATLRYDDYSLDLMTGEFSLPTVPANSSGTAGAVARVVSNLVHLDQQAMTQSPISEDRASEQEIVFDREQSMRLVSLLREPPSPSRDLIRLLGRRQYRE